MKKRKKMTAVVLAACLVLLGIGSYAVFQTLDKGQTAETAGTPEESPDSKGVLGRLEQPKNQADVLGNLDFAFGKSKDAVAWIQIPGTEINGLVMQGNDNVYYERRDEDGQDDVYGCYFADYECAIGKREELSQNTVIYGHGNSTDDPNGKRFSQLFRFIDVEFAKKHPYVYISTPENQFVFEIFSVFYTDTSFDYIQVNIDDGEKLSIAKQAIELSLFDYGITPTEKDRILTLSTCSALKGTDGSHRFVVMGRLCPADVTIKEAIALREQAQP